MQFKRWGGDAACAFRDRVGCSMGVKRWGRVHRVIYFPLPSL